MSRHWLRSFVLVVALAFPAIAQPQLSVVVQDDSEGRLRVTLSTRQGTNVRYIELSAKSMPEYPTVDVTCDRKLPTFPLTRTEQTGNVTVAVYELLPDAIDAMLTATECRLFVPGHTVFLPRNQRWAAWTESSKGTQSPKVLLCW